MHAVLDVAGCLPGIAGMIADLGNIILYSIEGNIEEAIKSFVFMLPGMDLLEKSAKYAAKGGKAAAAYAQALEMMHCLGVIGSAMLAANDLGNSIAGMIDKYLVNEEKVTLALGVEVLVAIAHGVQTVHFAGLTLKLPDQLDYYKIDDIIAQAKKKADTDTDAESTNKKKQGEAIDEDSGTGNHDMKVPDETNPNRITVPDDAGVNPNRLTPDVNPNKADADDIPDSSSSKGGCFVAGTLVKTEDGYKNIEDIKAGDRVYSRNMLTEEEGYREVEEVFVREAEEIVHLTIGNTCIDATINHPFWVEDYGFKPAGDLETGDVVVTASGERVQVADAEIEYLDEPVTVYNFEVMEWGTYYVSGLEVLVHNKCSDEGGSDSDIPLRLVKNSLDSDFLENMNMMKDKLPTWAKNTGNFGYSEIAIEGVDNTQFFAHSSIQTEIPSVKGSGISLKPESSPFTTLKVDSNNIINGEGAWLRDVDTEYKILSDIQSKLGDNPSVSGKIKLYTELEPCPSCQSVIEQFKEMYPNIDIEVLYSVNI